MIHGVTPGPLVFEEHPRLMYGIYASMLVASLCMLIVGRVGLTFFARIGSIPIVIIIPVVIVFCTFGAFLEQHSMFSVYAMFVFGIVGYFMARYGYSVVTFLIGFVIGPIFELSLRQSIIVTNHRPEALLSHPIAIAFLIMSAIAIIFFIKPAGKLAKAQQTGIS